MKNVQKVDNYATNFYIISINLVLLLFTLFIYYLINESFSKEHSSSLTDHYVIISEFQARFMYGFKFIITPIVVLIMGIHICIDKFSKKKETS